MDYPYKKFIISSNGQGFDLLDVIFYGPGRFKVVGMVGKYRSQVEALGAIEAMKRVCREVKEQEDDNP